MKKQNYVSPSVEKIELNVEENIANYTSDTSEKGWSDWVEI